MILECGNMWDIFGKTDLFYITTNPIRRHDGAVVMGRGIAKEAKDRYPDLPYIFGRRLDYLTLPDAEFRYTGWIGRFDEQTVCYFMVKDHWRSEARLDYIDASCKALIADNMSRGIPGGYMHSTRIDLNFPGIGNGKLKREDVLPIIEQLPDNVHVWEFE